MRQRLGQHFLRNKEVLAKEVAALDLKKNETVIEIGPGRGALTEEILKFRDKIKKLIAIEKDKKLAEKISEWEKSRHGENLIEIITGDVLKVLPELEARLKNQNYKIIGNIPYYLTGFLFRIVGELENKPILGVFIIQKEVAERVAAKAPKMNKLAASVQFWAEVEVLALVPKNDFSPPPEVESALIKLKTWNLKHEAEKEKKYYKAVNVLFQQPRKTILNNILSDKNLKRDKNAVEKELLEMEIKPGARPQDLGVEEILKISEKLFQST